LLVGNKCDQVQQRVITTKQGQWLAKKLGCPYMETSAKENLNVQEIFFEIVRMIERSPTGACLLESPFTEEWGNVKKKKCRIM
jgi:GTPase SAR1 family protein